MKISRDNYEAYFLDYHEGQLSHDMVKEVLLFVELNPDLKSTFIEFESITLIDDQHIVFENKSLLKKNKVFATSKVNDSNYEEFLISETEGMLNLEQLAALDEFISINPQFEKDRRLYALAHLPAENDLVFEAKESLKQKAIPVGLIDEVTFETYFARELEGDLNTGEERQLAEFMQYNPHLEKDRGLYKHVVLVADDDVIFKNKALLKHSVTAVRRIVYYALSAAASLALIMSFYFLLLRNDIPKTIAEQGKPKNTVEQQIKGPVNSVQDNQIAAGKTKYATKATTDHGYTNSIQKDTPLPADADVKIKDLKADLTVADRQSIEYMQARAARKITTRQFVDPQFTFIRKSQMYLNEQIEFYYNLKLSEQLQYAQLNNRDKNPTKTILKAVSDKAEGLFTYNKSSEKEEKINLSFWTIAELGVQTFNSVTSSELELKLRKDEEGKVVAYGLQGGILDFEKEVKK